MKKTLIFALCSLLLTTGTYATAARPGASVADLAKAAGASAENAKQEANRDVLTRSDENPRILALFGRQFRLQETHVYERHSENFYAHSPEMNIFISKWKMYDCDFRPHYVLEEQKKKGNPLEVIHLDRTGEDVFFVGHDTNTGNDMIYRFIQDNNSCVELALTVSPETQIPVSTSYTAIRHTPKKTITKNFVKGNSRFGEETY